MGLGGSRFDVGSRAIPRAQQRTDDGGCQRRPGADKPGAGHDGRSQQEKVTALVYQRIKASTDEVDQTDDGKSDGVTQRRREGSKRERICGITHSRPSRNGRATDLAYSLRDMRLPLSTFTMASDGGGWGSLAASAGLSSVGCCEGGADPT